VWNAFKIGVSNEGSWRSAETEEGVDVDVEAVEAEASII
jgi:hypothetical protein